MFCCEVYVKTDEFQYERANNVHRNFAGARLFVQVARDVSTVSEEEHCRVGDFCAEHWDEYIYGVQFTDPNVALVPGFREAGLYPLGAKVCTESKAAGVGWHLDHIRWYDVKWPEVCDSVVFLQKSEPGVQISSYLLRDPDFIERLLYAMDEVKQPPQEGSSWHYTWCPAEFPGQGFHFCSGDALSFQCLLHLQSILCQFVGR